MPEDDSRVLAVDKEGIIELLDYNSKYYEQIGFWCNENGGEYMTNYNRHVTYWMPLPSLPPLTQT